LHFIRIFPPQYGNNKVGAVNRLIELFNISKKYKNDFFALKNINLKIGTGEFISIIGHSGSGKSTLMNILGTLDRPTNGNILIDDTNLKNLSKKDLAVFRNKKIGFVFQNYNLIDSLTVRKNIELVLVYGGIAKNKRDELIEKALEEVTLVDKINAYPSELSGGQKQRVALARAIVSNPKIILADEPSGNLDPENSLKIIELFKNLQKQSKTIIMVTHDIEKTKYSDRIISIEKGEIA
jgi:putative ABC transport system ATP-binding protein